MRETKARVVIREYGSNLDGTTGVALAIFHPPAHDSLRHNWQVKPGEAWVVIAPDEIGDLPEPGVVVVRYDSVQWVSDWSSK